jgi:hypothetical protein
MIRRSAFVLFVLICLAAASPARAQGSGRASIGAGFTVQRDDTDQNLPGVKLDIAIPLVRMGSGGLLVVGDVDITRHREADFTNTNYLGGLRVALGGRVSAFGQFLAGVDRCCDIQATAYVPGGGVDFWMARRFALRGQIDFPFLRYQGDTFKQKFFTVGGVIALTSE